MSPITTHVLDTSRGRPAAGVLVTLGVLGCGDAWRTLATGTTDADGRIGDLLAEGTALQPGTYRLRFETGRYFEGHGVRSFYPRVEVVFAVPTAGEHFHVPLLLSPFGYSTYRGS